MKAIEIETKTDKSGRLKINYELDKPESKVRVIILLEDDLSEQEEEKLWLDSASKNPAFDFLHEPAEDVYTLNDGEPFED